MRVFDRLLAPILASSMALAAVSVPAPVQAAPAAADANAKRAEELYRAGKTKFETADYEEALALWKEAYSLLPDGEQSHVVRHALVYNISEAQIKAYEINRNVTHLRKAKLLLEDYLSAHRELYGDDASAAKERSEARERLRQVEKMIGEAESRGETATPLAGGSDEAPATQEPAPPVEVETTPPPPKPKKQLSPEKQAKRDRVELLKTDPAARHLYQQSKRQLVGGVVLASIGLVSAIVGLGAWGVATIARDTGTGDGRSATVTAAVFGIAGVGMLAGGGAMIGIGAKKQSALKDPSKPIPGARVQPAAAPQTPTASVSPLFFEDGGGASLTLRF